MRFVRSPTIMYSSWSVGAGGGLRVKDDVYTERGILHSCSNISKPILLMIVTIVKGAACLSSVRVKIISNRRET